VSRFEQPRDIKIVETIPRNPAGNVVRKELKTSYDVSPWRSTGSALSTSPLEQR
jgi:acyl-CoA synthetase (AMP-forming)/AMP-acid ligase II